MAMPWVSRRRGYQADTTGAKRPQATSIMMDKRKTLQGEWDSGMGGGSGMAPRVKKRPP
jgi:hypothetical protein